MSLLRKTINRAMMAPAATQPTTIPAIAPPVRPELEESDEPAPPVGVGDAVVEVEAEVAVSRRQKC
jgi:hypothetical protein